jgi:cob(I)alamin adenosyltransferase
MQRLIVEHSDTMNEQDYKNLITAYQNKLFDLINQNVALEARELKYRQTIEFLNQKISELEKKPKRSTRSTRSKSTEDF